MIVRWFRHGLEVIRGGPGAQGRGEGKGEGVERRKDVRQALTKLTSEKRLSGLRPSMLNGATVFSIGEEKSRGHHTTGHFTSSPRDIYPCAGS